ncbi:MAG TPA: polysaccharide deacetylase family protein [Gemmatimonadales bacterium]|nr:polysaccharide deacetylase family protein [Gemmatimonadales bacterium]
MLGIAAVGGGLIATGLWGAYAPNSRLFGPVVGRGPRRRVAFLTFDDGPNPGVTERVLEVLEREAVPATFFMVGRHVERYPETARAVARAGHEIGNHTYSHLKLHRVGPRRAAEEIRRGHETIAAVTGVVPRSFRAPHGYRSPFVARAVAPFRYQVFGWTFGVWDTARPGAETIRARVRTGLRPGSILLLHDGDGYDPIGDRWQTATALQGIIADVKAAGYRLAPLAELAAN